MPKWVLGLILVTHCIVCYQEQQATENAGLDAVSIIFNRGCFKEKAERSHSCWKCALTRSPYFEASHFAHLGLKEEQMGNIHMLFGWLILRNTQTLVGGFVSCVVSSEAFSHCAVEPYRWNKSRGWYFFDPTGVASRCSSPLQATFNFKCFFGLRNVFLGSAQLGLPL